MIDPRQELYRLRDNYRYRGVPEDVADELCSLCSAEIEDGILSAIQSAYTDAVQAGLALGADEFVREVKPVSIGNSFRIVTESGRMDFSEPPFPMLPTLLKGAKVSKEGHYYKRIPVGKKSETKKLSFSLIDVVSDINKQREDIAAKRKEDRKSGVKMSAPDPMVLPNIFTKIIETSRTNSKGVIDVPSSIEKTNTPTQEQVTIRTASSKQDQNLQWIKPAKELNMAGELMTINSRLESDISDVINFTVLKYEGMV